MRLLASFISKYLFLAFIFLSVFFIFEKFSYLKLNTADSSIYLSTAENIAHHKGAVVSYNLCQCFKTLYHPLLPYYQPLYPLFSSLFIDHGGIVKIIKINILLFALNVTLIFYIIQRSIPTSFNVIFIYILAFSFNFFISALYPWTEQFHFFCFICSFILFLKFKDHPGHLFWLGILNGIFMLVRVAHMFNFLAYIPVLFIGNASFRQKLRRAAFFVGGFILAYGLYQIFCLSAYHVFYPEYARPGASYGFAHIFNGIIYNPDKVGIQLAVGSFFTLNNFLRIAGHIRDFYLLMPLFLWPAVFYYFLPIHKRVDGGLVELCISQSLFIILGYSVMFYWSVDFHEAFRYSLIPYVLISVAGWYCLYQGLSLSDSWGKKIIGGLMLLSLLYPQVNKLILFQSELSKRPMWERPFYKDLMESYHWIDNNLPKEILVASDEEQEGYFMHRPYISLPPGESYNCTNLKLFDHIYAPDYYLLSNGVSDQCFTGISYVQIFTNDTFRVLEVKRKKRV